MSALKWDQTGERLYETGVKKTVLYPQSDDGAYPLGCAWNGVTSIKESPSGAEATDLYANDAKYLSLRSAEEYGFTIEAYTYPDEWASCDGSAELANGVTIGQQSRQSFGLCYRTILGNDTKKEDYGYKLHLIYNATASPSEEEHDTVNDSPDATTLSWDCDTIPLDVEGYKPTACITIDSTKADADKLAALEEILYGSESEDARLPLPDEIISLMSVA